MPGPVVHTIIAEQLPTALEADSDADVSEFDMGSFADAARDNREALVFGAQGPDFLFLNPDDWLPDGVAWWMDKWSTMRAKLSAKLWEFTRPLRNVKTDIANKSQETLDDLSNSSNVVDELTNLQARFKYVSMAISEVLSGFVKKTVLDHADPFGLYVSPTQTCGRIQSPPGVGDWVKDHDLWSWFDTLHTRRTGAFAKALLDIATGEEEGADGEETERPLLMSYALGYLSHIAGDATGHAYVNMITGGPYRLNQSQRHTTQEKIMDVWAYDHYYEDGDEYDRGFSLRDLHETEDDRYYHSAELVDSGMHKNFQFTVGEVGPQEWVPDPNRTFDQGSKPPINSTLKLPDAIADNFAEAAGIAYEEAQYGELGAAEVATAYRKWYSHFRGGTGTNGPVHPEELDGHDVRLTGPLKDELEELLDEVSDLPDALTDLLDAASPDFSVTPGDVAACAANVVTSAFTSADADCLEDAAEAITGYVADLAAAVADAASEVFDVFVGIFEVIEAAAAIPLRALNFLLQMAYEKLWALYKDLLMLVCATGFGSMFSEDLSNDQFLNMWNPTQPDDVGNSVQNTIMNPSDAKVGFPRKGMKAGHTLAPPEAERLSGLENDAHLLVPFTEVEYPRTLPGPDVYGDHTPELFIDDPEDRMDVDIGYGSALYDLLPDPEENSEQLGGRISIDDLRPPSEDNPSPRYQEPVLGDAVSLTVALFKRYKDTGSVPNFNLSGDRAIAYPTWASKNGCTDQERQRWSAWHGSEIPWLIESEDEPIEPKFLPDVEEYY